MKLNGLELPDAALKEYCRRNRIRELSAFGSVLRADFGPDSDVDLLVDFEPDAEVGFLILCRMQRELSALVGRKVDLVPKDGLKPRIRQGVLEGCRVLYAA